MKEPLGMVGGRKIRTVTDCESPFELFLYFKHFGRGCIRCPLKQAHIVAVMENCRYTIKSMSDTTSISPTSLGKWKKKYSTKSKGHVYIVLDHRQLAFKVGITRRSVEKRVKELETSLAGDLEVFLVIDALHPEQVEKFLHCFLKDKGKHLKREWFDLDKDTLAYLGELKRRVSGQWLREDFCVEIKHWRMWKDSVENPDETKSPEYIYQFCL